MKIKKSPGTNTSNIALFVSLYLVVLSFFIVLTTTTKHDQKRTNDALRSVKSSFQAKKTDFLDNLLDKPSVGPKGEQVSIEEMLARLKNVIKEKIKIIQTEPLIVGNKMQLKIPKSAIFKPGDVNVREDQTELLENITKELTTKIQGLRKEVEFIVGIDPNFIEQDKERLVDLNRAGLFAEYLENNGVDDNNILVGVSTEFPDLIIMNFRFVSELDVDTLKKEVIDYENKK